MLAKFTGDELTSAVRWRVLPVGDVPLRYAVAVTVGGVVSPLAGGAGTVNVKESEPLNVGSPPYNSLQSQMIVYVPPVQSSGIGMLQEVVIGADWYHVTSQVALLQ